MELATDKSAPYTMAMWSLPLVAFTNGKLYWSIYTNKNTNITWVLCLFFSLHGPGTMMYLIWHNQLPNRQLLYWFRVRCEYIYLSNNLNKSKQCCFVHFRPLSYALTPILPFTGSTWLFLFVTIHICVLLYYAIKYFSKWLSHKDDGPRLADVNR